MSTPISIVIVGILIAFAILITGHWQISVAGPGRAHRLDRWTGAIADCRSGEPCEPLSTER
jgi:hypothetical protein